MGILSKIIFTGVTLCSITAAISRYINKEEEEGIDKNPTPSLTPFQTDSTVPPAPKQLFMHPNSSETFQFRGHNTITTFYFSTSPHLVEVTIGGNTDAIEINRCTKCSGNHYGYYGKKGDIDYSMKPVVRIYNEACERI